jgi:hypothetical protein
MKMTWKRWPTRASLSRFAGSISAFAGRAARSTRKGVKYFFTHKFNGAAILVTIGAAIVSLSVASIYRPAGGILWGLFIILAAIDMRR